MRDGNECTSHDEIKVPPAQVPGVSTAASQHARGILSDGWSQEEEPVIVVARFLIPSPTWMEKLSWAVKRVEIAPSRMRAVADP